MATNDSDADAIDWSAAGYIQASDYRCQIVEELLDGEATPTDLAEATPIKIEHVSRALQELRERDLVELRVDEDVRKGRYYGLTERGRTIAPHVLGVNA